MTRRRRREKEKREMKKFNKENHLDFCLINSNDMLDGGSPEMKKKLYPFSHNTSSKKRMNSTLSYDLLKFYFHYSHSPSSVYCSLVRSFVVTTDIDGENLVRKSFIDGKIFSQAIKSLIWVVGDCG